MEKKVIDKRRKSSIRDELLANLGSPSMNTPSPYNRNVLHFRDEVFWTFFDTIPRPTGSLSSGETWVGPCNLRHSWMRLFNCGSILPEVEVEISSRGSDTKHTRRLNWIYFDWKYPDSTIGYVFGINIKHVRWFRWGCFPDVFIRSKKT